MPASAAPAVPKLLPPPGPSVYTLRMLPDGRIEPPPSSTSVPTLFYDALAIRAVVFVVEQSCSADEDPDPDDSISWHWVIYADMGERKDVPVAAVRLIPAQAHASADDEKAADGPNYAGSKFWDHKEPYVTIGRLATIKECRGRGYAKSLVKAVLEYAGKNAGVLVKDKELGEWKGLVLIHAQTNVEKWYAGLGFERDEGMGLFYEEGIEHVGMWQRVKLVQ